jgi:transcriptional regulator with XRE-family HTH domain
MGYIRTRHIVFYGVDISMSIPPTEIFPSRLRSARDYRGFSQGDLADKTGLQPSAISHFETGSRKPSFDNLRLLADKLDVSTDYLLGLVDDFNDMAGASTLHRHYNKLQGSDRKVADELIAMLANKVAAKTFDKK